MHQVVPGTHWAQLANASHSCQSLLHVCAHAHSLSKGAYHPAPCKGLLQGLPAAAPRPVLLTWVERLLVTPEQHGHCGEGRS